MVRPQAMLIKNIMGRRLPSPTAMTRAMLMVSIMKRAMATRPSQKLPPSPAPKLVMTKMKD
ncbi:hypothetical protein KDK82_4419 [Delftia sp. K82]|nr:cobalt-zinc-cadmium resistance protein CzcB [Delftia acidovorans CCUG 15835]OWG15170.1 hypothetical protein KDK82_4419 [Delftia sp. K82]